MYKKKWLKNNKNDRNRNNDLGKEKKGLEAKRIVREQKRWPDNNKSWLINTKKYLVTDKRNGSKWFRRRKTLRNRKNSSETTKDGLGIIWNDSKVVRMT